MFVVIIHISFHTPEGLYYVWPRSSVCPGEYYLCIPVSIPTAIKNASQKSSQYLFVFLTKGVILVGTL